VRRRPGSLLAGYMGGRKEELRRCVRESGPFIKPTWPFDGADLFCSRRVGPFVSNRHGRTINFASLRNVFASLRPVKNSD
jgi:hypothetical protein